MRVEELDYRRAQEKLFVRVDGGAFIYDYAGEAWQADPPARVKKAVRDWLGAVGHLVPAPRGRPKK